MVNNGVEDRSHALLVGILLVLAYFFLMFGNSIVSLTHPDEVFYIQSAKEMLAHGSWLTPMIFDEVQFEKPFLPFAMFALAIKWFGLTPFAGRFWPSFFGIVGVGTVYWIAWTLFNRKRIAFLAGLILQTSFIYLALSRAVLTDMIFSVLVTIAIGCFCTAYYFRKYKTPSLIMCFVFSAMAVLTKGLLGFLFPGALVILFLFYRKDFSFLKCKATIWGVLLFLALAVPWHILMYVRHGSWFLQEYFFNVHWRRVLEAEHRRLDNWYFYLMLMILGVMPWFLFWIPTLKGLFNQFRYKLALRDKFFFLVAWIIAVYAFVQPAHSKLASYIFPAFPAIAILLAYTLNEALEEAESGRRPTLISVCGYVMPVILMIIAVAGIFAARHYSDIILDLRPIYGVAAFVFVIAALIFIFNFRRMYFFMYLAFVGIACALMTGSYFSRSFIEPWVSCKSIMDIFKTRDQSATPVLASKFYVRGVRFYSDRPSAVIDINGKGFWSPHPIPFLNTDHAVVDFLNQREVTWAVLKEGNVEDIRRILKTKPFLIDEFEMVGGKYILRIEKSPED